MADINKPTYMEVTETVWAPHRDAPSLLGEGWNGCTLTEAAADERKRARWKTRMDAQRPRTYARAKAELAEYGWNV